MDIKYKQNKPSLESQINFLPILALSLASVIFSKLFFSIEWSGPSPESRMFSPSWGYESTIHFGQQFQGTLLPMATGNSHTVHHYAFPQTWHHAVTPQNFR